MIIKKISSAALICIAFSAILNSCSILEKNSSYEISSKYNVSINRDFWGIPYIKGESDKDVAYGRSSGADAFIQRKECNARWFEGN